MPGCVCAAILLSGCRSWWSDQSGRAWCSVMAQKSLWTHGRHVGMLPRLACSRELHILMHSNITLIDRQHRPHPASRLAHNGERVVHGWCSRPKPRTRVSGQRRGRWGWRGRFVNSAHPRRHNRWYVLRTYTHVRGYMGVLARIFGYSCPRSSPSPQHSLLCRFS